MNALHRQLVRYLIVGCAGVGIDALLYVFFLRVLGFSIPVAKTIGVVSGVIYGYLAHCRITFAARVTLRGAVSYCILYALSIALNVVTNSVLVSLLPKQWYPLTLAFLGATAVSVVINFIGMKLVVFKKA